MIEWFKRAIKSIVGAAASVVALPIVQLVLLDSPLNWTIEHAIAGAVVGVTIYVLPNKQLPNSYGVENDGTKAESK